MSFRDETFGAIGVPEHQFVSLGGWDVRQGPRSALLRISSNMGSISIAEEAP